MIDAKRTRTTATWAGRPLWGVLLDLDGTLLDTAAEIARALNRVLAEHGWAALPLSDVSRMIGRGAPMLIERAAAFLNRTAAPAEQAAMVQKFFDYYEEFEESDEAASKPYPGVVDALRILHEADLRIAVVTNKQQRLANGLLRRLDLAGYVDLVVGGDTCERRKPDPQPLLFACSSLNLAPDRALMVGDSVNDVSAARAASIPVICVPYGYNEGNDPYSLDCDAIIETLADLPPLIWP